LVRTISLLSPDGERRLLRQASKVGWGSNRNHPTAPRLHCESQPIGGGHSDGHINSACVLAIVGVRLFDREIQMEWVASGQVIQFVTVMVLLSVITALSLSNVLKENTLGTLLGGIAGYVLAQGVGRAAARDAARGVQTGQRLNTKIPEDTA